MPREKNEPVESTPMKALRKSALRLPETEEGTSCVNRAFRVGNKAFAYLGMKADRYKLMVKLTDSLTIAESLQAERPDNYIVGKHGWTTIWLPHDEKAPKGLLEGFIAESYRALIGPLPEDKKTKKTKKKKAR